MDLRANCFKFSKSLLRSTPLKAILNPEMFFRHCLSSQKSSFFRFSGFAAIKTKDRQIPLTCGMTGQAEITTGSHPLITQVIPPLAKLLD
jgi:hypothetical protein